jgi:hypothetical protein
MADKVNSFFCHLSSRGTAYDARLSLQSEMKLYDGIGGFYIFCGHCPAVRLVSRGADATTSYLQGRGLGSGYVEVGVLDLAPKYLPLLYVTQAYRLQ